MITPSFSTTASQTVSPKVSLDFTTASLDPRITFTRSGNTATVTNSSGNVAPINADLPRFDYNPITLACKGLLIEETRTNLFSYSEDFTNAVWTKSNTGATTDAAQTNPSGATGTSLITGNAGTAIKRVRRQYTTTGLGPWSWSAWIKSNTATNVMFVIFDSSTGGANNVRVTINLTTGVTSALTNGGTATGATATVTAYPNSWYRVSISGTFVTALTSIWGEVWFDGLTSTTSTASFYLWGAQLEAGAFPTSYIPNVGNTTNQRDPDIATMTGTNFSDWYNASKGTFRVDAITPANGTRPIVSVDNNSANNSLLIKTEGTAPTFIATQDGNEQANVAAGTITANSDMYAYVSYDSNYFGIARAASRQVDTSGTVPTVDRLRIGASQAGAYLNGIIKKIQFWN